MKSSTTEVDRLRCPGANDIPVVILLSSANDLTATLTADRTRFSSTQRTTQDLNPLSLRQDSTPKDATDSPLRTRIHEARGSNPLSSIRLISISRGPDNII